MLIIPKLDDIHLDILNIIKDNKFDYMQQIEATFKYVS